MKMSSVDSSTVLYSTVYSSTVVSVYLDTASRQTRVAHHHHALPGLGPGGVAELAPGHHSRLVVEQIWQQEASLPS